MNQSSFFQRYRADLLAVLGFLVLAGLYFSPVWQGRQLAMSDIQQSGAAAHELAEFHKATGRYPGWTDALFGGMPSYMIAFEYPNTFVGTAVYNLIHILPNPVNLLLIEMLSMYLLLSVLGVRRGKYGVLIAALGSVGYALGSLNMLSIEAGHISKIYALGFAPGLLAGVVLTVRGNHLTGGLLTALFVCLQLMANHLQITYYVSLTAVIFGVVEGIALLRNGQLRQLAMAVGVLLIAAGLGAATNMGKLLTVNEYSKETIRGRSELTGKVTALGGNPQKPAAGQQPGAADAGTEAAPKDGLDKTYAFQYSYGLGETLTLLMANAYGGASGGGLTTNSETYKIMVGKGVDPQAAQGFVEQGVPLYWGDQPAVGGPVYAGAVLLFLFILGMFISTNRLRWAALSAAVFLLMIGLGRNLLVFNGFMFDHFPMFNKFRAVTMTFTLVQLFIALGAVLGVQALFDQKWSWATLQRPLLISLGLTAGLAAWVGVTGGTFAVVQMSIALIIVECLQIFRNRTPISTQRRIFIWIGLTVGLTALVRGAGGALLSFQTADDSARLTQIVGDPAFASQMLSALIADRQGVLRADALRTVFLILLAAGFVWLFVQNRIKPIWLAACLLALVTIDLYTVDKRYLNNDDFKPKRELAGFSPTPADEQILTDKTLSYRVLDLTGSFMNDNRTSYFHKSIGGYHAAKLRRYQELIEYGFPQNQLGVLNMLNGKYIIQPGQPDQQGQPTPAVVQTNPTALGNAWFVRTIVPVADADAEITALQRLNPRDSVLIDKRFTPQLTGLPAQLDPTGATIQLTAYEPDHLTYQSSSPREQLAVFSEIYYRGETDWNAYVDGKKVPHVRADYVLRAMRVPAGNHKIEFRFEPPTVALGNTIDLIANVLLILLLGFGVFRAIRSTPSEVDVPELAATTLPAPDVQPDLPASSLPTNQPGKMPPAKPASKRKK